MGLATCMEVIFIRDRHTVVEYGVMISGNMFQVFPEISQTLFCTHFIYCLTTTTAKKSFKVRRVRYKYI